MKHFINYLNDTAAELTTEITDFLLEDIESSKWLILDRMNVQPNCFDKLNHLYTDVLHGNVWDNAAFKRAQHNVSKPRHIVAIAIIDDDVDELLKQMARPNFDIGKLVDGQTSLLNLAITWGSYKCFKCLMLNGASRQGALETAITSGRNEMIEVLGQDGLSLDNVIEWADLAIKHWHNDILKWRINVFPVDQKQINIIFRTGLNVKNWRAIRFLLKNGYCSDEEQTLVKIGQGLPSAVVQRAIKLFPQFNVGLLNGIISRDPFDIELADFLLDQAGRPILAKSNIRISNEQLTPEANSYIRSRKI